MQYTVVQCNDLQLCTDQCSLVEYSAEQHITAYSKRVPDGGRLLLLFSRRRKALSPRKHSRLAILAKDTGIATFDTKLKISRFQQSRSLK